jgi:hypothetical protein
MLLSLLFIILCLQLEDGLMSIHRQYGMRSVADVCREAGVNRGVYERRVRDGLLPRPTHTLGAGVRSYFTVDEATNLVARLRAMTDRQ